jgi:hypothetical protein
MKRKNASPVWEYFKKEVNGTATCQCGNLCKENIVIPDHTTSILFKHLESRHGMSIKDVNSKNNDTNLTNDVSINKYFKVNSKTSELSEKLVYFVCFDTQPLSVIENLGKFPVNLGFINLFNFLCNKKHILPSRTTLTDKLLTDVRMRIQEKLIKELSDVQFICVSCDGWSTRDLYPYVSLSFHYLDSKYVRKCILADLIPFSETKSFDNISSKFTEYFEIYNIYPKIIYGIADNALNGMFNRIHLPNHGCLQHTLHLIISDSITGFHSVNKKQIPNNQDFNSLNKKLNEFSSLFYKSYKK